MNESTAIHAGAPRQKRIGLLYPDPEPLSPSNWSGTPSGLCGGLIGNGVEVVPIPCNLPVWERVRPTILSRVSRVQKVVADRRPAMISARTRAIAGSVAACGYLDGIIAMGTDMYDLHRVFGQSSTPIATYDDGTIELFRRYPGSDISLAQYPSEALAAWSGLQATAWRSASAICMSTDWAKRSVLEDFGINSDKVHVVGMGHTPRRVMPELRDYSAPRFLFVGVDWRRKNGDAVLSAFAKLRDFCPAATLDVVGHHEPIVQDGVTDHGFLARTDPSAQHQLEQLYARATVFVLPSLFDPSAVAYLEAASAGLPVIASMNGGADELTGDGAIIVNPHDPSALLEAMMELTDEKAARAMGRRAKAKAAQSTWHHVSSRILMALQTQPAANSSRRVH